MSGGEIRIKLSKISQEKRTGIRQARSGDKKAVWTKKDGYRPDVKKRYAKKLTYEKARKIFVDYRKNLLLYPHTIENSKKELEKGWFNYTERLVERGDITPAERFAWLRKARFR